MKRNKYVIINKKSSHRPSKLLFFKRVSKFFIVFLLLSQ